jgi:cytochrome c-type biogenesis protein CcsB
MAHASSGMNVYDFATFAYLGAFLLYALHAFFFRQKSVGLASTLLLVAAWALHTVFLVERALFYNAQYQGFVLPATNMFEAISYFAWLVALLYLIVETGFLKTRLFGVFALIIPSAAMAYTAKWMDQAPRELMPSLKSYWLVFHITAMFISYAAFAIAFTFALMYILRARGIKSLEKIDPKYNLRYLDEASYKLVLFGFPVLTLGVFLGAVWADSAWGRYWGWDPKETWALITWFIYLAYLHLRLQWNLVGYRSALLNIIGFVAVLVTFQGVNMLVNITGGTSIHAYAQGGGAFILVLLALAILIPVVMHFLPMPAETDLRKDEAMGEGFTLASTLDAVPDKSGKTVDDGPARVGK